MRSSFTAGVVLMWIVGASAVSAAQANGVVRVYRDRSDHFPVEVVGRDTFENSRLLEMLDGAIPDVLRLTGMKDLPVSRCVVRWKPGASGEVLSFPRSLRLENGEIELEMDVRGECASQEEAIYRTLIIGLLQAFTWRGEEKLTMGILPEPALWLGEGVLWSLLGYRHEDWTQVVEKAYRSGKTPTLSTVQQWTELSDLSVERAWQEAFSYFLFQKATQSAVEKEAVLLWLKKNRVPSPEPFWAALGEAENWWQEQNSHPLKQKIPILSWDRTVAGLNQLRHFSLKLKNGERKMLFIDELPEGAEWDTKDQGMGEYLQRFDRLILSGHFALNPVLNLYRQAVVAWYAGDYRTYRSLWSEARKREQWVFARRKSSSDMLDWAVVNLDIKNRNEMLTDYLALVRELEGERLRVRREFQEKIFTR